MIIILPIIKKKLINNMKKAQYSVKIVLVGDPCVGKTNLIKRICSG